MLLGFGRWSCDSEPSSPTTRGPVGGSIAEHGGSSDRLGQGRREHRRTASSSDATPRPQATSPRTGPFPGLSHFVLAIAVCTVRPFVLIYKLDFGAVALLGRHNISLINVLGSDPGSSHQPTQRRLGFFPSSTATHSKTSPPQAHPHPHPDQSHSHSRSEAAAYKDTSPQTMSSAASSSAANKVHTSPTKVSLGGVN